MDDLLDNNVPATGSSVGSDASLDRANDQEDIEAGGTEPDDKVKALQYCHPDYLQFSPKWKKYLDFYESEDIYRFLHKHGRETEPCYDSRVKRGYFYNYVASVVDLFVSYLYHAPITRPVPGKGVLSDVYKDADRRGTSYDLFIQQSATFAQVAGHTGILVDIPREPEGGFANEAERKAANHRPYLTRIQAEQITDWELDEDDNFEWVKILIARPQGRDWTVTADTDTENYLIWRKDGWEEWQIQEKKARLVGSGENPLGVVPLVIVRNDRLLSHAWFGASAVRDIVDINGAILNWSSLGDEEIFERCLNVLAMEGDQDAVPQTLSHHNVLAFQNCNTAPYYLTPGDTPLKLIGDWIERGKDEIYRLAKLGGSTGLLGVREATSGVAYAFEFNETNQSLSKKAESLEQAERDVHKLLSMWAEEEIEAESIRYPREFGVDDFLTELQVLLEGRTALTSKAARVELEKKVARKMFAKDPQELRQTIEEEIEAGDGAGPDIMSLNTVPSELLSGPGAGGLSSGADSAAVQ